MKVYSIKNNNTVKFGTLNQIYYSGLGATNPTFATATRILKKSEAIRRLGELYNFDANFKYRYYRQPLEYHMLELNLTPVKKSKNAQINKELSKNDKEKKKCSNLPVEPAFPLILAESSDLRPNFLRNYGYEYDFIQEIKNLKYENIMKCLKALIKFLDE